MMLRDSKVELRKRQINTLKIFNDNVVVLREDVEYLVLFVVSDIQMALKIFLPPDFPNEKPILKISHTFAHHWIPPYTRNVVGAPGLLNFSRYTDLGRVVQAIVREFVKNPPLIPDEDPLGDCDFVASVPLNAVNSTKMSTSSPGNVTFPDLASLSTYELREMLDNPDTQDNYLKSLPELAEMERLLNDSMDDIKTLANINKEQGKELQALKDNLNTRLEATQNDMEKYETLTKVYNKLSQAYTPHKIMDALQGSVLEADKNSEMLAKNFLDGTVPIESFLKLFLETRSRGHKLRAHLERLTHQLEKFDEADAK